jgi:nicotinamidase/pyrazinamidase
MGAQPSMISDKTVLLIIDPQVDFHPGGNLAVPGANEDSARTAQMIMDHVEDIDEIYITLDSHHVR